jgi:hypothetical protein
VSTALFELALVLPSELASLGSPDELPHADITETATSTASSRAAVLARLSRGAS